MNETSLEELNELFIDILERASIKLLSESDEEIEYQLFEEFDIGSNSFLHINTLKRLEKACFINEEIKALSLKLREMSRKLLDGRIMRTADVVRTSKDWHRVLELSDRIKNLKARFHKSEE